MQKLYQGTSVGLMFLLGSCTTYTGTIPVRRGGGQVEYTEKVSGNNHHVEACGKGTRALSMSDADWIEILKSFKLEEGTLVDKTIFFDNKKNQWCGRYHFQK